MLHRKRARPSRFHQTAFSNGVKEFCGFQNQSASSVNKEVGHGCR